MGVIFKSSVAGNVVGARYYKHAGNVSNIIFKLWSYPGGSLLANVTRPGDNTSGWASYNFAAPVAILAETNYVVSAYSTDLYYNSSDTTASSGIFVPLSAAATASRYLAADGFPSNSYADVNYGTDVIFDDLGHFTLPPVHGLKTGPASVGHLRQIRMLDPDSGDLTVGIRMSNTEGNPETPSMAIDIPNARKFRWGVLAGTKTISVRAKQVSNTTGSRPRLVIRANPAIGVLVDVVGEASSSADWVTIGPLSVTVTGPGVLLCELQNVDHAAFDSPAYFDHIVVKS